MKLADKDEANWHPEGELFGGRMKTRKYKNIQGRYEDRVYGLWFIYNEK